MGLKKKLLHKSDTKNSTSSISSFSVVLTATVAAGDGQWIVIKTPSYCGGCTNGWMRTAMIDRPLERYTFVYSGTHIEWPYKRSLMCGCIYQRLVRVCVCRKKKYVDINNAAKGIFATLVIMTWQFVGKFLSQHDRAIPPFCERGVLIYLRKKNTFDS